MLPVLRPLRQLAIAPAQDHVVVNVRVGTMGPATLVVVQHFRRLGLTPISVD